MWYGPHAEHKIPHAMLGAYGGVEIALFGWFRSDLLPWLPLMSDTSAVPGTEAEVFIQWKGTDVCLDFWCPCGEVPHFDGYFAYVVRCPACERTFALGTQVKVIEVVGEDATNAVEMFLS